MEKAALILEGGALRALYTAGVVDELMRNKYEFELVIGISAGALTGMNYISDQLGRTAEININNCDDKEYLGIRNMFRKDGIFNIDFIFDNPGHRFSEFDRDAFENTKMRFLIGTTNVENGKSVFFENPKISDFRKVFKATASMPLVSKKVMIDGVPYLDGGIADSIPYRKAISEGYRKIVVVRTRDRQFRKPKDSRMMEKAYRMTYRQYPQFTEVLVKQSANYNLLCQRLNDMEKTGQLIQIAPEKPVTVARTETDKGKLRDLYNIGIADMKSNLSRMREYLDR